MEEILEAKGLSARELNRRKRLAKQETAREKAQNCCSAKLEVKLETNGSLLESKAESLFEIQSAGAEAWQVLYFESFFNCHYPLYTATERALCLSRLLCTYIHLNNEMY